MALLDEYGIPVSSPQEAEETTKVDSAVLQLQKDIAEINSALGGNIKSRASVLGGDPEALRGNNSEVSRSLREKRVQKEQQLGGLQRQRTAVQDATVQRSRVRSLEELQKGPQIDRDFVLAAADPQRRPQVEQEYEAGKAAFQAKAQAGQGDFNSLLQEATKLTNLAASLDFQDNSGPFFKGSKGAGMSLAPGTDPMAASPGRQPGRRTNEISQLTQPFLVQSVRAQRDQAKAMEAQGLTGLRDIGGGGQGFTPPGFSRQPVDVQMGGQSPFSAPAMSSSQDVPGSDRPGFTQTANELVAPPGQQLAFSNINGGGDFQAGTIPAGSRDFSQMIPIQGFPGTGPGTGATPSASGQAQPLVPLGPVTAPQPPPPAPPPGAIPVQPLGLMDSARGIGQMNGGWPPAPSAQAQPGPADTPQQDPKIAKMRTVAQEMLKTKKPEEVNKLLKAAGQTLETLGLLLSPREAGAAEGPNIKGVQRGQPTMGLGGRTPMLESPGETKNLIRVKEIATNKTGWIDPRDFNEIFYEIVNR